MAEKKERGVLNKVENRRAKYNITGVAGEYFVAAELSRRGWIATLTLKNTPNIDLIATTPDGSKTLKIQVKTRSVGNRQGWLLSKSIEQIVSGEDFYIAFVDLVGEDAKPDYFLIPKNLFAEWSAKSYQEWISSPGRAGRVRVDNTIRTFDKAGFGIFEKYHNNWDI